MHNLPFGANVSVSFEEDKIKNYNMTINPNMPFSVIFDPHIEISNYTSKIKIYQEQIYIISGIWKQVNLSLETKDF